MDEASRLVSELQQKLSELDHKVWLYRRDMASEFTKYAEDVLRDVPKDVSETVSKAIAESLKGYKSINPELTSSESCATGTGSSNPHPVGNGTASYFGLPTTVLPYQRDQTEVESPRSPHAREKEFQGLFTPSYLPLLDSTSHNERRSSHEPIYSPPLDTKGKEKEIDAMHVDANTDTRSLVASPELQRPPIPKRRNTDELSVTSDASDGPVRRSALRRSSSSSKGLSPRRVRFDVEGEEVLPTASPLPTQSILSGDSSLSSFEDFDEEGGAEQVEDIDALPPKRISSSQALRALSRGPFEDDGTQWTTVSAPPDGSASVPAVSGISLGLSEDSSSSGESSAFPTQETEPLDIPERVSFPVPTDTYSHRNGDDTQDHPATPSDDEMLDMPPLKLVKSNKSAATMLSPISPPNIADNKSPTSATRSPSTPWFNLEESISKPDDANGDLKFLEDDDNDQLFHFDENNENNDQRSPLEEHDVDTDSEPPVSPVAEKRAMGLSELSRSPARDIPRPSSPKPAAGPAKGIVGSYKGRPFSMPIVSDEIHAQAASLGAMSSFVGSVTGRSGLDESDVQSFRASGGLGSFSGTPKSMSERMMMDELLEIEESKQTDTKALGG